MDDNPHRSALATDFRELHVYRMAFTVAMRLYEVSKKWPSSERFGLTDQVRRSSRSVCASIAEAWHRREYPRHFASKLGEASSEAAETLVWIDFAVACGYLDHETADELRSQTRRVTGGLVKMKAHARGWCIPTHRRS
jgi:four helix bundle protein